jgi:hypothetical protein
VALFSPDYAKSPNCRSELTMASDFKKPTVYVNVGPPGYDHKSLSTRRTLLP